ncbi:ERF family protein [Streptomyces sp. MC1]|uniref:ERF family protein n=1 Tax=Streptomyces sp. MC1 TaxID=295105 RepID=UPI0018CB68D3|nr:ERF family protein [Streptomyces sp. MC1]MBG7704904.1 ERF family protein [Streptomyces sp. MC1]
MAADIAEQAPEQTAPPADPTWSLTVDQAMVLAMREIGAVGKNGTNEELGYKFRKQEDLVAAIRGPMAKYGVRMLPRVIDQKHFQRGKSNVAILTVEYIVRGPAGDVMDPPIQVVGEGADVSDKASNKAMTAAKKYAIIQAFEIAEANVDESDTTSPDTAASPADWYVNQLRSDDVWYNRNALGRLRQRIFQYGHGDLVHPDTGLTILQTIEERGDVLLQKQQERDEQRAGEREARDAQMRAEHPEYHRSSPDDDLWQHPAAPGRAQQAGTAAPALALPDPTEVEQRLAAAMADPQDPVKRLNEVRKHYTVAVLKQIRVNTKRGQVDGNTAITYALQEIAQRGKQAAPSTPPPPAADEHQRPAEPTDSAEPSGPAEAPGHAEPSDPADAAHAGLEQPQEEPQAEASGEPSDGPEEPSGWPEEPGGWPEDPEEQRGEPERPQEPQQPHVPEPPQPPQPRPARTKATPKGDAGREALECEVAWQAQMLGKSTLEHIADLLPAGGTGVEDIQSNMRLQALIREHRPAVVGVLISHKMHRQAEEYSKLGQRVPALNIHAIIESALKMQTSF